MLHHTLLSLSHTQADSTRSVCGGGELPVLSQSPLSPMVCEALEYSPPASWSRHRRAQTLFLEQQVLAHHVMVTGETACGIVWGHPHACASPHLHGGCKLWNCMSLCWEKEPYGWIICSAVAILKFLILVREIQWDKGTCNVRGRVAWKKGK